MKEFKAGGNRQESEGNKSIVDQAFMILRSDALKRRLMDCQRVGDRLSFYTLFVSEADAKAAHDQLVQLRLTPRLEGKNLYLTVDFRREDIDRLAETFTEIPSREKE